MGENETICLALALPKATRLGFTIGIPVARIYFDLAIVTQIIVSHDLRELEPGYRISARSRPNIAKWIDYSIPE